MMFGARRKDTERMLTAVTEMERQVDRVYTALVVRDPGTSVSAEAYEGLRKQVIVGATAKQAHVAQLAEFDVALRRGASTHDLQALVSQWLDQAGVTRIEDPAVRDAFDGSVASGAEAEVEIPGYFIASTGQLVRQGRLRERAQPASEAEAEPATANAQAGDENAVHKESAAPSVEPAMDDAASDEGESAADVTNNDRCDGLKAHDELLGDK